jgi:hypothetical protein
MFDEVMITGQSARRKRIGIGEEISFSIRIPWYRSLYLSCFQKIDLRVGGVPKNADEVRFTLYGTTYSYADLKVHDTVNWFVLDEAEISLDCDPQFGESSEIAIDLTLYFRIPYHNRSEILEGKEYLQVGTCSRVLPIEERIAL